MWKFGSLLLVTFLVAHGYLILIDHGFKSTWEQNIKQLAKNYNHEKWETIIPIADEILLAIAALQILSVFHLIYKRLQVLALLNIIGMLIISAVMTNPLLANERHQKNTIMGDLFRNLSIIGGLLWFVSSSFKNNRVEREKANSRAR